VSFLPRQGRHLLVATVVALGVAALPVSATAATTSTAGFETGDLSEIIPNTANGTVVNSGERAAAGSRSMRATYLGGGGNGFARANFELGWPGGSDITYSGSFFLPDGFKNAMQGQVGLMRWDNYTTYQSAGDVGGIVMYGNDKQARLIRGTYSGSQSEVSGPFNVPENRWFTLTVRQRISTSNPISEIWLDGARIASTTAQNSMGRAVDMMRFGIVSMAPGAQTNPLTLWADQLSIGPTGSTPPPPPPTDPPPSNLAPTVTLTQPVDGSSFRRHLTMAAEAGDDKAVTRVEFRVDGTLKHTDTTSPYGWTWNRAYRHLSGGAHTVQARAFDAEGLSASDSAQVYERSLRRRPR
jgi:hypothetical protein